MLFRRIAFRGPSLSLHQAGLVHQSGFRFSSVFNRDGEAMRLMMEREIRSTLARLERLIQVVPADDHRVKKAIVDHTDLQAKFQSIVFDEGVQADSEMSAEELQTHMRGMELRTKKLMTVAKSKYYMLKVNFPKQAELVDNEPLIEEGGDEQSEQR